MLALDRYSLFAKSHITVGMSKIRYLEKQSGMIRLLLFLHETGECMLSKIWPDADISVHQGYKALDKCKELDLIKSRVDNSCLISSA